MSSVGLEGALETIRRWVYISQNVLAWLFDDFEELIAGKIPQNRAGLPQQFQINQVLWN